MKLEAVICILFGILRGANSMKKIYFFIIFLILMIHPNKSYSLMTDYLALDQSELGIFFPVTLLVEDFNYKFSKNGYSKVIPVGRSGAHISRNTYEDYAISGKAGIKEWEINVQSIDSIYISDLDKNGITDLILVRWTMGCGMAPSAHISTFMFDKDGLPIPAQFDCYLEQAKKDKISEIYDIDGDGHADLIHMYFNNGYWVTNIYQAKHAHWLRVKGMFKKYKYPTYTRYLERGSRKAVNPKKGKTPKTVDLSNEIPFLAGKIVKYQWAKVHQSEDVNYQIVDDHGINHNCAPESWYSSCNFVIDNNKGRRIINYMIDEKKLRETVDEIVNGKYQVRLFGSRDDSCSPELICPSQEKC